MPLPHLEPSKVHRTSLTDLPDILEDFPYKPSYATYGTLRYAWIEVLGPIIDLSSGKEVSLDQIAKQPVTTETVVCLHGEPTWSYLYRKMIPGLLRDVSKRAQGGLVQRRVLAPDFIGFGRSDKPIDDDYYTFGSHRDWLIEFVRRHVQEHPLTRSGGRVTLVLQDWGGILGLLLPSLCPDLITHMIVMNTALGVGTAPTQGWLAFRDFMARSPDMDVGGIMRRGTPLNAQEVANYAAPFAAGRISKAGVRAFPRLVPVNPNMRGTAESRAALAYYRALPRIAYSNNSLEKPSTPQGHGDSITPGKPLRVFVACGMKDPVLGEPVMRKLAEECWAGIGYHWTEIKDGGHFVQEWCTHLPALVDQAWAEEDKSFTQGEARVQWNAPRALDPLPPFGPAAPPPRQAKEKL